NGAPKKKRHRGGRRRKNRRQSFIAPSEAPTDDTADGERPSLLDSTRHASQRDSYYRVQQSARRASNTSLESEALLDHREHAAFARSRRDTIKNSLARVSLPFTRHHHRASDTSVGRSASGLPRSRLAHAEGAVISEDDDDHDASNDRTPLLSSKNRSQPNLSPHNSALAVGYGSQAAYRGRRSSKDSRTSSRRGPQIVTTARNGSEEESHHVNNPPSVPGSPQLGTMDDVFLAAGGSERGRDAIVDIVVDDDQRFASTSPQSMRRRPTLAHIAERDVCFPDDVDISDHGEESPRPRHESSERPRRRRGRKWPDLEILDHWSREEKEERTHQEILRAKKISEPVMVNGRLRPAKTAWHREEDDSPFRFTYFNETLDGTIHARTISDLQDGMTFRELFLPDPIALSDSDDSEDEGAGDDNALEPPVLPRDDSLETAATATTNIKDPAAMREKGTQSRQPSIMSKTAGGSANASGNATPKPSRKRYGPRPTFWLDVLQPTETEMKVLSKAFGIHQLTAEDILMDEQREKVELFPSYYFVNYRTFEQDKDSENYMDAINMYVIVFRDGVITFHSSMSPHPANVRRRIRQLNDYMSPTADWISYAIIDDITDVYAPLVTEIETEVDEIDEEILYMHTTAADNADGDMGAMKAEGEKTAGESGGDMLRRVGECRKKVMSLYRLLGNKADVIKGFAKRCNEHWEVAPRSEIGLYLGDIQDHIVTMTANLSHYERQYSLTIYTYSLLSRAHGNYVAQINIRMNERAEQNADVLGKLTVLGTIVLPMNIITGMWGMNVWVPGQDIEGDLTWFFCITAGLIAFGLVCYFIARKVYGIV
ncbi:uncharacterized protein MYCFIDRAFT_95621, partial [Pseudocercospora fijiensis CIRAD86]